MYPLPRETFFATISQGFGIANKHYRSGIHNGVDFAVVVGTPVVSPFRGEIYQVFKNHKSMGNACYYRFVHQKTQYWMRFLHLRDVPKLGVYNPGDVICYSGNTGDSTGPHLHMELWKVAINPALIGTKAGVLKNLLDPVAWFRSKVG